MVRLIAAAAAVALFASPAFGTGCTGIGKGSPQATQGRAIPAPINPCKPGDSYDATKNLCTAGDGSTYTPSTP